MDRYIRQKLYIRLDEYTGRTMYTHLYDGRYARTWEDMNGIHTQEIDLTEYASALATCMLTHNPSRIY